MPRPVVGETQSRLFSQLCETELHLLADRCMPGHVTQELLAVSQRRLRRDAVPAQGLLIARPAHVEDASPFGLLAPEGNDTAVLA